MNQANIKAYWKPSFDTLCEAWYQELLAGALLVRWERIDATTLILVATTASGSAIAGWALWTVSGWKLVWIILAGIASVMAIVHGAMRVPSRIKEQEERRRAFTELRIDLETFRHQLVAGLSAKEAKTKYADLRRKLSECMGRGHTDITYTKRLGGAVQDQLDTILKGKGYVK